MGEVNGETPAQPSRRRAAIAAIAAVALLVVTGVIIVRVKTVDAAEYAVLDAFVDDAFPRESYEVGPIRLSDAKPCWWWCEDYQLHVDLRTTLAADPGADPAQRCAEIERSVSALVGEQPSEPSGYHHRECVYVWWGFEYGGRTLRLDVDVSEDPNRATGIYVQNLSARRTLLPQEVVR